MGWLSLAVCEEEMYSDWRVRGGGGLLEKEQLQISEE